MKVTKTEAEKMLTVYQNDMIVAGLSQRTIDQYMGNIGQWLSMQERIIDGKTMQRYREYLISRYAVSSVNLKLISINRFLRWMGWESLMVKTERTQRISSLERIITKREYQRMMQYARETNRIKTFHIMRTIALTGIRVGELQYITMEAVKDGIVKVFNKGKHRYIYLPPKLCRELLEFGESQGIQSGILFFGRKRGKAISTSGVWRNLQYIADQVGVPQDVVYPHSFRHLFAKTYMQEIGNITELSDLLGHSRLETTRIYTRTSAAEKRCILDKIDL